MTKIKRYKGTVTQMSAARFAGIYGCKPQYIQRLCREELPIKGVRNVTKIDTLWLLDVYDLFIAEKEAEEIEKELAEKKKEK